jgi:20S proteasome alpha/beta subunit
MVMLRFAPPKFGSGPFMTLISAVKAEASPTEGIVMVADGRTMDGPCILSERKNKLTALGHYCVGVAGTEGLTSGIVNELRRLGLAEHEKGIEEAASIAEWYLSGRFAGFYRNDKWTLPHASAGLLLSGYDCAGKPRIYILQHGLRFFAEPADVRPMAFVGGDNCRCQMYELMKSWEDQGRPQLTVDEAKAWAVRMVSRAHLQDPTVGEPVSMCVVTPDNPIDVSNEISHFVEIVQSMQ